MHFQLIIIFSHQLQQKLYPSSSYQPLHSFPDLPVNSLRLSQPVILPKHFAIFYLHTFAKKFPLPEILPLSSSLKKFDLIFKAKVKGRLLESSLIITAGHNVPPPPLSYWICLYNPYKIYYVTSHIVDISKSVLFASKYSTRPLKEDMRPWIKKHHHTRWHYPLMDWRSLSKFNWVLLPHDLYSPFANLTSVVVTKSCGPTTCIYIENYYSLSFSWTYTSVSLFSFFKTKVLDHSGHWKFPGEGTGCDKCSGIAPESKWALNLSSLNDPSKM